MDQLREAAYAAHRQKSKQRKELATPAQPKAIRKYYQPAGLCITKLLIEVGSLIGILVVDHVIIGDYYQGYGTFLKARSQLFRPLVYLPKHQWIMYMKFYITFF